MNPYDELGVPKDATTEQINAAFRSKARTAHPDAGGDPDTFHRLSRAVALLRDENRRHRYDQTGQTEEPDADLGRRAAIEILVQAFDNALNATKDDARFHDLAGMMRNTIRRQIAEQKEAHVQATAFKAGLLDALKRVKHKGDGADFLNVALNQKLTDIGRTLEAMEDRLQALADALEMAADYEWMREQRPMQGGMFNARATTTTTFL